MKTLRHVVSPEEEGRLIKQIVRGRMGVSHRLFSQVKFSGGLLLDGERVMATAVVHAGQTIELLLPGEAEEACAPGSVHIVYEDDDIFIVNKPAPLPCQSSERQPGDTLEARMKPLMPGAVFRPVNRLDKGTSGLMLVARHAHAQDVMQRRLHTEDFIREYCAVVVGAPMEDAGVIDAPIRKADGATIRREVAPDGKPSRTQYRVEKRGKLSVVRLRLETGRTHQIRVHMAHSGCPVFGDFLYGQEDARLPGRFALHSAYIGFFHPETGKWMEFSSPLPEELQRLILPEEEKI